MQIRSDLTVESVLAKMGYAYNPRDSIYTVIGFRGFTKKIGGGNLCHSETVETIRKRNNLSDIIILLGTKINGKPVVMHSILADRNKRVLADTNIGFSYEGKLVGNEYKENSTDKVLYTVIATYTVQEFFEKTQMKRVETAKIDSDVLQNAIRALYIIFFYIFQVEGEEKPISPSVKSKCKKEWETDLYEFAKIFGVSKVALKNLLAAAYDNKEFTTTIDNNLSLLGKDLFKARDKMKKDLTVPKQQFDILKNMGSAFRNGGDTALKFLEKAVSTLKDTDLAMMFSNNRTDTGSTGDEQKEVFNDIKKLFKKYLKVDTDKPTKEQVAALKAKNAEAFKTYSKLRIQARDIALNFTRLFVRQSGKPFVSVKDLEAAYKKNKIVNSIPTGFTGNIDEASNLVTSEGLPIQGIGLALKVEMNPKYKPKEDNAYVLKFWTGTQWQNAYTNNYIETHRAKKKEKKLTDLQDNYSVYRKKWLADMKGKESREKYCAAAIETIFLTGGRKGDAGNESVDRATGAKVKTHGITTLLVSHVSFSGDSVKLAYTGKGMSPQDYVIKGVNADNKKLITIIKGLTKDKKDSDPLWTFKGKQIPTTAVSKYWKSLGTTATLHSVRHLLGTKIAADVLKDCPLKKGVSQTEAEKWFKEAMKKVGEQLGHHSGEKVTATTALKNYVDPSLQKDFFKKLGLREPSWLAQKSRI